MPKIEPKIVQKELEQGRLWPVYWIYGQERMKSRELLKRIKKAVLGEESGSSLAGFAEENFDGSESSVSTILDAAQSLTLGGGLRLIVVREAHALKDSEELEPLLGPPAKKEELASVCVFLSKDLDARKKFSKLLIEKAAVVPCEDVAESEREPWVGYLAKRRGVNITPEIQMRLAALDPWSLDIVDQELEKLSLSGGEDALLPGSTGQGSEQFLDAFFARKMQSSLQCVEAFAEHPDEALPLLGLFSWNVRQLALVAADREHGTRHAKLNPYVQQRMEAWSRGWKLSEIQQLQSDLAEIDFGLKQTPLLPLGMWDKLVMKFCR